MSPQRGSPDYTEPLGARGSAGAAIATEQNNRIEQNTATEQSNMKEHSHGTEQQNRTATEQNSHRTLKQKRTQQQKWKHLDLGWVWSCCGQDLDPLFLTWPWFKPKHGHPLFLICPWFKPKHGSPLFPAYLALITWDSTIGSRS